MKPRGLWEPAIGRLYGIRPWEMGRLTATEVEKIDRELKRMDREARKQQR